MGQAYDYWQDQPGFLLNLLLCSFKYTNTYFAKQQNIVLFPTLSLFFLRKHYLKEIFSLLNKPFYLALFGQSNTTAPTMISNCNPFEFPGCAHAQCQVQRPNASCIIHIVSHTLFSPTIHLYCFKRAHSGTRFIRFTRL